MADKSTSQYMKGRKTLELNASHPIIQALSAKVSSSPSDAKVSWACLALTLPFHAVPVTSPVNAVPVTSPAHAVRSYTGPARHQHAISCDVASCMPTVSFHAC